MAKGKLGKKGQRVSAIKNKCKRAATFQKASKEHKAEQRKARKVRQKEVEALGDAAPKPIIRTLDNTREEEDGQQQRCFVLVSVCVRCCRVVKVFASNCS